jgi:hypothetical protein
MRGNAFEIIMPPFRHSAAKAEGGSVHKWKWLVLIVCLVCPLAARGQQRPLRTDDAEILKTGRVRAEVGVEFLQKQRF